MTLRRYKLVFNIFGIAFVRHVRARDEEHAGEQAETIQDVLTSSGIPMEKVVIAKVTEDDDGEG